MVAPPTSEDKSISDQIKSEMFLKFQTALALLQAIQYDEFGHYPMKKKRVEEFQARVYVLYLDLLPRMVKEDKVKFKDFEEISKGNKVNLSFKRTVSYFIELRAILFNVFQL